MMNPTLNFGLSTKSVALNKSEYSQTQKTKSERTDLYKKNKRGREYDLDEIQDKSNFSKSRQFDIKY